MTAKGGEHREAIPLGDNSDDDDVYMLRPAIVPPPEHASHSGNKDSLPVLGTAWQKGSSFETAAGAFDAPVAKRRGCCGREAGSSGRCGTSLVLNLAMLFERADEVILPAVYAYVAASFAASPVQLSLITLARALVQALASPLGGALGHYYNRGWVITLGCLVWGCCTLGFSTAQTLGGAIALWAGNGLGLCLVVPNVQSLTADLHPEDQRGRAFGLLHLTSAAGGAFGGLYATNLGAASPLGLPGWRFAFFLLGLASLAIGMANGLLTRDPRCAAGALRPRPLRAGGPGREPGLADALRGMGAVLRVPTFLLIVGQGIVGNIPGQALAFQTLYLQLLGMSPSHASLVVFLGYIAHAGGGYLGGWLGDVASRAFPRAGRIAVCQFSVLSGMLWTAVALKALPHEGAAHMTALYAAVFMLNWGTNAWPAPACNNPVFAEIVPAELRTFIYAFDRSFEMAIAACATPLVGLLAQRFFGFVGDAVVSPDAAASRVKADSLSSALTIMTTVPWALCVMLYTGLYLTYPRDKAAAQSAAGCRSDPGALDNCVSNVEKDEEKAIDGGPAYVAMKVIKGSGESGWEGRDMEGPEARARGPGSLEEDDRQPMLDDAARHDEAPGKGS